MKPFTKKKLLGLFQTRRLKTAPASADDKKLYEFFKKNNLRKADTDNLSKEEEEKRHPSLLSLVSMVSSGLYSTIKHNSVDVITQALGATMDKLEDVLLKSFFKKPEAEEDSLQKAPEGGDDAGNAYCSFMQKVKKYSSLHELTAILRWNSYQPQKSSQPDKGSYSTKRDKYYRGF